MSDPLHVNDPATLPPASPPADLPAEETPTLPPDPGLTVASVDGPSLRSFGDYELLEEIARGGMGVVYKARQISLHRIVALKMILAGQLASAADVQRFHTEAEAAANLDHPNIVPIYEVGEHEGQHYFSMKLIDGGSLAQQIPSFTQDAKATAQLMATVAQAVHHAHQRGILHRDLKPGNILLDGHGQPHVTDFGLAKRVDGDTRQTQTGAVVGTPSYMPPEQARSEKVLTTAVDVYSLGAILYELLTGRPPFRAGSPLDTVLQVLDQEPERPQKLNPDADRDLETICLKCLEKQPARRYDSAAALAGDLERWLRGEPILARPSTAWERTLKWAKRKPATAALVSVSALAAFALFGVILASIIILRAALTDARDQRDLAKKQQQAAEARQREADEQRQRAATQEAEARKQAAEARKSARLARLYGYASDLTLAEQARESENGERLLKALQRQIPKAGQEDLRSFEWYYLWNLCHPERRTFGGGPEASIVYSPDGRLLAMVAGPTNVVKVWETDAARPRFALVLRGGLSFGINRVRQPMAFSPDSRFLAVSDPYGAPRPRGSFPPTSSRQNEPQFQIHLGNTATGSKVSDSRVMRGMVYALAFSADGRTLNSVYGIPSLFRATEDGNEFPPCQLGRWHLAQHRESAVSLELSGWSLDIEQAIFSPDGKTLATTGWRTPRQDSQRSRRSTSGGFGRAFPRREYISCLWDVTSGQLRTLIPRQGFVTSFGPRYEPTMVFAPASQSLALLEPDGSIRRLRSDTGEVLSTWKETGRAVGLAFRSDGKILAVAKVNHTVDFWNVAAGRKEWTRFSSAVASNLVYSPDDKTLAATNPVRLWDADSRPTPRVISLGEPGDDAPLAFSPDGKTLICGQWDEITFWDLESQNERGQLKYPPRSQKVAAALQLLGFPQGQSPLVAVPVFSLALPYIMPDRPLRSMLGRRVLSSPYSSLALSADGRFLASRSLSKMATIIWDLATGQVVHSTPELSSRKAARIYRERHCPMLFATNSKLVCGTRNWEVGTWQERAIALLAPSFLPASTLGLLAAPLGQGAFLAGFSAAATRIAKPTDDPYGWTASEIPLANSPDGSSVLTYTRSYSREGFPVMVRDQVTGQMYYQRYFRDQPQFAVFSSDGQTAALAVYGGNIWNWKPGTNQDPVLLQGHTSSIISLTFSPDGRTIVSASADGTVKCWDPETGQERLTLRHDNWQPRQVLFASDGQMLAVSWLDPADPSRNGIVALYPAEKSKTQGSYPNAISHPGEMKAWEPEKWKAWGTDPNYVLNELSWAVVRNPGAAAAAYREALLQAEEACRLVPDDGNIVNTLGVAQYRAGHYQQAVATLLRSDRLNTANWHGSIPGDLAFLAMAYARLGQTENAKDYFHCLQETMKKPQWAKNEEAQAFLREAETVVYAKAESHSP
jgi:WD40 repeat protein/tRNA A-37 threonylcarbamoyl transferase component Bud32